MRFFKFLTFTLLSTSNLYATDLKDVIMSREIGSCETRDLNFSAMKFYKIPLQEKHDSHDVYLRVILFFNADGSLSTRYTTQALVACQTTTSGIEVCSFKQLSDRWIKGSYGLTENIYVPKLGVIQFQDESNSNRGFILTFSELFPYEKLRNQSFIGGMITVNFNQDGVNVISICK